MLSVYEERQQQAAELFERSTKSFTDQAGDLWGATREEGVSVVQAIKIKLDEDAGERIERESEMVRCIPHQICPELSRTVFLGSSNHSSRSKLPIHFQY